MIEVRPSLQRGHFDFGWLDTRHTFSFGDYRDPKHMGFRDLRVINEDKIQPGQGFGTHSHQNMEIISYVVQGALAHKDSMGNGSSILPGEVQYMSAGSGVTHSEFNYSKDEVTHLLQIWILPNQKDSEPRYNQKSIALAHRKNRLYRVVGPDGSGAMIEIHQDASMYASVLDKDAKLEHTFQGARYGWIQVVRGKLEVNDVPLAAGDGCALSEISHASMVAKESCEFLFFDLN